MIAGRKISLFQEPTELKNLTCRMVDGVYFMQAQEATTQLALHFKDRQPSIADEDDVGMFGVVLQGYLLHHPAHGVPQFAVKRMRASCHGADKDRVVNGMKKEVYCHRILERRSYYFLLDAVGFIIYPWQSGVRIRDFLEAANAITPLQILRVITDILEQVQRLHQANISHGDLSGENVLLDPATFHGAVVDLGSAVINCQPAMLKKDMKSISYLMERLIDKLNTEDDKKLLTDTYHQLKIMTAADAVALCTASMNEVLSKRVEFKASL